ncbi:MAG: DUF2905 domain-containing protein [Parachlamydiales bacterium]|nr:DUF2905 domain-containing protein [Parachlamydiales bacterium]
MIRFLMWMAFFLIAGGVFLHYHLSLPFLDLWVGKLPGDLRLKNANIVIYLPCASAFVSALSVTIIGLLFRSSSKEKSN